MKQPKRLVVDACVARSAGEKEYGLSSCCRETLDSVREFRQRIVMTEAIQEQWHKHASGYGERWLAGMYARKQVYRCQGIKLKRLDKATKELSTKEQRELGKDLCLIEGACAADRIIVTRDDAIVRIWQKCGNRFGLPKPIRWINPVIDGVEMLEHL